MLVSRFFVIDNAHVGCENDIPELSAGQELAGDLFQILDLHVEPGINHCAFVESSQEIDNNLIRPMVIHHFEFSNITVLLHKTEEAKNDLR